jgi:putative endopeptidase
MTTRNSMRVILWFVLFVLVLIAAGAVAQGPTPTLTPTPGAGENPFGGEGALRFSPDLVDRTVSPCDDFYRFACGGWLKANPIPPEYSVWSRFAQLTEKNQEDLARILQRAALARKHQDERAQKLGDYWISCVDEAGAEKLGLAPVEPALTRIGLLKSASDVVLEAGRLRRRGIPALFAIGSAPDARNSRLVVAEIDQGGVALPDRGDYSRDGSQAKRVRDRYLEHVTRVFELAGDDRPRASQQARAVLRIETALAAGFQTLQERRDPRNLYNPMKEAELEKLAAPVPWKRYFAAVGLKAVEPVNVASPRYFRTLDSLLKTASLEEWKSYLRWTVLHEEAPRLTKAFVDEDFLFFGAELRGARSLRPRWRRCAAAADGDLRDLLGQVYVRVNFQAGARTRGEAMLELMEKAMDRDLSRVDWMDDETRAEARRKLSTIVNRVGYPDKWMDMSKLTITRESWPANAERAAEFRFDRELARIGQPNDRLEWRMTPSTVAVSYGAKDNAISIPAGILQEPFFGLRIDDAPNFGAIGVLIGRAITRSLEGEGSRYDADGDLRDWWSERAAGAFRRRAACVAKQFSEYAEAGGPRVDGRPTLEEDVADLGGLEAAFAGFQHAIEGVRDRVAPKIEGFTPEQRFFLGFAQSQCRSVRPEEERLEMATDPHSPSTDRVNGPLSNMRAFREAFGCSGDAPMVRRAVDACEIW